MWVVAVPWTLSYRRPGKVSDLTERPQRDASASRLEHTAIDPESLEFREGRPVPVAWPAPDQGNASISQAVDTSPAGAADSGVTADSGGTSSAGEAEASTT
ncbi:hypothetical protein GCM10023096_17890 [Nonomuraea ferruginea]